MSAVFYMGVKLDYAKLRLLHQPIVLAFDRAVNIFFYLAYFSVLYLL